MKSLRPFYIALACLLLIAAAAILLLGRNVASPGTLALVESQQPESRIDTHRPRPMQHSSAEVARPARTFDHSEESTGTVELIMPVAHRRDEFTTPSTLLHFLVVEEGSRLPLERVTIAIKQAAPDSEELRLDTGIDGQALFANVQPGTYNVRLLYGRRPPIDAGEVLAVERQRVFRDFEYPARTRYRFQLVNEQDQPMPYHDLRAGVPMFQWSSDQPILYSEVRTDGDGRFEIKAYPDMRPLFFQSRDKELFSAEPSRGWGNPYAYRGAMREENEAKIYVRGNVVHARGILMNPPVIGANKYFASVRGSSVNYWSIAVEKNEFTFIAPPGEKVQVSLMRRVAPELSRGGLSREKTMEVSLPAEAGEYVFQIPFDDMLKVHGRVMMPNGEPADNVRVRAVGFGSVGGSRAMLTREAEQQESPRWTRGGESSILSEVTDSTGAFTLDLPRAREYLFVPEPAILPDDAKGADPVTLKWEELADGRELIIFLQTSSIIWGEVVDESGAPVARASVTLRGSALTYNASPYEARTNGVGIFEMNVPPIQGGAEIRKGSRRLYLSARRDNLMGLAPVVPDSVQPIRIKLHRQVDGVLVVTQDGAPVTKVEISSYYTTPQFNRPIENHPLRERENPQGRYRFNGVPRGITWFTISTPGAEGSRAVQIPSSIRNNAEIKVELGI